MSSPIFHRLIRFSDSTGEIHYGEVPEEHAWDTNLDGISVPVYEGTVPWDDDFHLSGVKTAEVSKVLSPVPYGSFIYGVGLNYRKHAEEGGFPIPPHPVIFIKFPDALANPYDDIPIHPEVQNLDYEGELAVIIGRDCKNLSADSNPLDFVLGYTVSNDVSSRYWQDAKQSGGQAGYAKSFDKFAPLGPILVSSQDIPDPSALTLRTKVNGELRQESGTNDLIFGVPEIIRHLSRGMTLRKGSVIMTGTPSGVAAFQKGGPKWLRDGDVVEIEVEGIGKIRNKMVFEK